MGGTCSRIVMGKALVGKVGGYLPASTMASM